MNTEIKAVLPKHSADKESSWDEQAQQTDVWIYCPACRHLNETCWEFIERASKHKCEKCGYEWEVGE